MKMPEDAMELEDHRRVTVATVIATGGTRAKAARLAGVSVSSVYVWLQQAEFREMIARIQAIQRHGAEAVLRSIGETAARALVDLVESKDEKVRLRAACEILDRVGLKAPQEVHVIDVRERSDKEINEWLAAKQLEVAAQGDQDE